MSQDTFARAARAVRETYDGRSARGEATRRSLLARATASRRRRRKIVTYVLPLAAVLALSTAWAAVTGRLPWKLDSPKGASASHPASSGAGAPGVSPSPPPPAAPVAPAEPAAPPSIASTGDETLPVVPPAPAAPRGSPSGRSRPSAAPPRPSAAVSDAEEALYSAAHRLHFVDHDPPGALKGWDAYLSAYPGGRFALEARYNRALTLVRLDRRDEARAALAPFADGTYGGYRQREAEVLLEALSPP